MRNSITSRSTLLEHRGLGNTRILIYGNVAKKSIMKVKKLLQDAKGKGFQSQRLAEAFETGCNKKVKSATR